MKATWRALRRAPGRTAASVVALALALGAIGVFAVPSVASHSLRDLAARDRLAHLTLDTTPIPDPAALAASPRLADAGITVVETRAVTKAHLTADRDAVWVVGLPPERGGVDVVRASAGRLPRVGGEIAPGARVASALDGADLNGLRVVGTADTAALADADVVYTTRATAEAIGGLSGPNQLVARVADPTRARLDAATDALRAALAEQGVAVTELPLVMPGGRHPMEDGITEISGMIGMLGILAGIVALVLLASTTNAIVTERSRDAAVMRALGAPGRNVRRELRRVALAIATLGLLVGIPLGIVVSNAIARMVLDRFAGITPALGWSPAVALASTAFALVGARLISGRAARRLTRLPLVDALRDRDGVPFGNRFTERAVARLRTGSLNLRMATRSVVRRRGRAVALVAQVTCAVGAVVCVASLTTSVADFNRAELASWRWATMTTAAQPGAPFVAASVDAGGPARASGPGIEAGLETTGRLGDDWELDVWGVTPQTAMLDTRVSTGRWLDGTPGEVVVAEKIARQLGYAVGDEVTIGLASGSTTMRIVGLHPIRGVTAFVDRADLGARLGVPGGADTIWSTGDGASRAAATVAAGSTVTETVRRADLYAADGAGRDAIVGIFVAIGAVVAGVATIGVVSTVGLGLHERRRELAVVRALGGRRSRVRRLVVTELVPLAAFGWAFGLVLGWAASWAIMLFFETSSGVELGHVFATVAAPATALGVGILVVMLGVGAARSLDRHPPGAILRAAS